MPIYEYLCEGCQQVFEVMQSIHDKPPAEHSCGSTQVKRILSRSSFILKGTGWYATDYMKKPASTEGKHSGTSEATSKDSNSNEKTAEKSATSTTTEKATSASPAKDASQKTS
jgi:putative FmdB family regulatory protein